jgi:hypothetical protein
MKRLTMTIWLALLAGGATAVAADSAAATNLCVGAGSGCYATLQAAVDAAHDGDTIGIGRGTFAGGVQIDVSVKLVGAGARSTIISGGAHVLTVGEFGASSEPTVSIRDVSITGGAATSSPESVPFVGAEDVIALGGGIEVPPGADFTTGATVTISDSVIIGNRAAPTASVTFGEPCPGGPCPFALAAGGGIDNWGTMTLVDTVVSDNRAGSAAGVASDVEAGGIVNWFTGTLRLVESRVSGNRSAASAPNGRFAENGGIWSLGTLAIDGSLISGNSAALSAAYPNSVGTAAQTGGVHVARGSSGTIRDSVITANTATATNSIGDAVAFVGGVNADGSLVLRDSAISNNRVSASVPAASSAGASADSGALGIGDSSLTSVADTRFTGNSVSATAPAGLAFSNSGAISTGTTQLTTISDSLVSGNTTTATSTTGSVIVEGAGIGNIGLLALRDTTVSRNTGTASGPSGIAQGGGIWNGALPGATETEHQLTLTDSAVTLNTLTAGAGITVQGGGLFTTFPVTLKDSVIARNVPDQCFGC